MSDDRAGPWTLPIQRKANVFLKAQNAAIGPTALIVSAPQGLYRVSLSICVLFAANAGQLTLSVLGATAPSGTVTKSLAAVNAAVAGSVAADTFMFEQPAAASGIFFLVTAAGLNAGSLSYTVRAVVESVSLLT